jgi:hypothetical protein
MKLTLDDLLSIRKTMERVGAESPKEMRMNAVTSDILRHGATARRGIIIHEPFGIPIVIDEEVGPGTVKVVDSHGEVMRTINILKEKA